MANRIITVRLCDELHDAAKRAAALFRVSLNAVCVEAIEKEVASRRARYRRLMDDVEAAIRAGDGAAESLPLFGLVPDDLGTVGATQASNGSAITGD